MATRVRHELLAFRRTDERLSQRWSLDAVPLAILQLAAYAGNDDPEMVGEYKVEQAGAGVLAQQLGIELDFSRYEYVISCFSGD